MFILTIAIIVLRAAVRALLSALLYCSLILFMQIFIHHNNGSTATIKNIITNSVKQITWVIYDIDHAYRLPSHEVGQA